MPNYQIQKQETKIAGTQLKCDNSSSHTVPVKVSHGFGSPLFLSQNIWERTLPFRSNPKDRRTEESVDINLNRPSGEQDGSGTLTSQDLSISHKCSSELISNAFAAPADWASRQLRYLLRVAIDFTCGSQTQKDAAAWNGVTGPHRTWIWRLYSWRDRVGILATDSMEQVFDHFGHQDDETAYVHTRRTVYYFWFRICEIAREVESFTVPAASNPATFRARCGEFLLLCSHAWDALEISMKYDVKAITRQATLPLEV